MIQNGYMKRKKKKKSTRKNKIEVIIGKYALFKNNNNVLGVVKMLVEIRYSFSKIAQKIGRE